MISQPDNAATVWQTARISRIERQTATVKTFELVPAFFRPFDAGQHLDVRLTAPDGYAAQRSYSISSAPEHSGAYELTVERLATGEVSPYFHDVAEAGDEIEIRGPFGGHFIWRAEDGGPLMLIAGGSGIAPLMSILRHRDFAAPGTPASLVYAGRTWDDLIFRDELIAAETRCPSLSITFALSRDQARRPHDLTGRVDAVLLRRELPALGLPKRVLVCGSNPFVETVTTHLLDLGVNAGLVRTERFGG